ncbi:caspase family protein [Phreatobacter stygius]|nr:caspase family protein [Phreatobacter stygius]
MRSRRLIVALLAALSLVLSAAHAAAGPRVALAIGVSAYRSSPLPSPVKDATEMARALAGFGFAVTLAKDPNSEEFKAAVDAFIASARGAEAAIVYFSGHGLQVNGEVYMMASDTRADRPETFQRDDFTVNGILDRLQTAGVDFKFVIVDACRGNPFLEANGRTALATANAGRAERRRPATHALVSFSSASGQLSQDWGGSVGLSLYTSSLLEVMRRNDRIEVRDLTQQTRALVEQRVASRGANAQNPWEGSSLVRPVHLARGVAGPVTAFLPGQRQDRASFDRRDGRVAPLERLSTLAPARGRNGDMNVARPLGDGGRGRAWEYNTAVAGEAGGGRAERRSAMSSGGRYGTAEWR